MKASAVEISGADMPLRTATPISARPTTARLPARAVPSFSAAATKAVERITKSALAPALSLLWIAPTDPKVAATLLPVSCAKACTTASKGTSTAAAARTTISAACVLVEDARANTKVIATANEKLRIASSWLINARADFGDREAVSCRDILIRSSND